MTDAVSVIVSVFLGVSVAVPVALIVAMAMRQPRDVVDFAGWIPPDENTSRRNYRDNRGNALL